MSVSQGGLPPGKKREESKDSMDAIIEDNSQELNRFDKTINIVWIKGHSGVKENEMVDNFADQTTTKE
ncbi:unnamed protein product [Acanthoscelides obtectus]|uniref:RNase H type-1 domain-containing protein n=1 Tax=Acanthoscelides obtectus TaxID=200917 RepID=A0A9P0M892_ACAOB|nr:unnamed protein product [Acanthoscelides obtectus]CAK1660222.1 hypothetical protein AOBTE_LOCUS21919 [Acanthoscelides obtectus]